MRSLIIICIFALTCAATCGNKEGIRIDKIENKAAEQLCNSTTLEKLLEGNTVADKQIGREYLCMCQQVAKGSDQNLCETIVNGSNTILQWETCKNDKAEQYAKCLRLFERRK